MYNFYAYANLKNLIFPDFWDNVDCCYLYQVKAQPALYCSIEKLSQRNNLEVSYDEFRQIFQIYYFAVC